MRIARMASGVALLACTLLPPLHAQRDRVRMARPFFQLRLEEPKLFTESHYAPVFTGLADILAEYFGVDGGTGNLKLVTLWAGLSWPIEVTVLLDRQTSLPLVGLWMPPQSRSLLDPLVALSAGTPSERGAFDHDGAAFARVVLTTPDGAHQLSACEGMHGGRRLLLLGRRDSVGEPAEGLARFLNGSSRTGPAQRALAQHAVAGDLGWVFDFRSLLASTRPEELGPMQAIVKLLLGPRFGGISGRMSAQSGRFAVDLFADLRPGRGWVGTAIHREPREMELAAWVPANVTDFVAVDASVAGVLRLLNSVSIFGGADRLEPGDFFSELRWLDVDLEEFLDTHITGQVIAVTEVGGEGDHQSLRDLEGVAVGVGVFDGARLFAEVRRLVAESPDGLATITVSPALGPGIHTVTYRGRPHLYLAAGKDVIFIANADVASVGVLRKCLATGGRGAQVVGGEPVQDRVCTMLGRGHVLEHVMGEFFRPGLPGEGPAGSARLRDAIPGVLRGFLEQHSGIAEWHLDVTSSGARLHVEF